MEYQVVSLGREQVVRPCTTCEAKATNLLIGWQQMIKEINLFSNQTIINQSNHPQP